MKGRPRLRVSHSWAAQRHRSRPSSRLCSRLRVLNALSDSSTRAETRRHSSLQRIRALIETYRTLHICEMSCDFRHEAMRWSERDTSARGLAFNEPAL
jgi:hypothetical protein